MLKIFRRPAVRKDDHSVGATDAEYRRNFVGGAIYMIAA
jgi:hypothetical protein